MKIIPKLYFLCLLFFYINTNAQAPDKMSYQALIRIASNNLVSNQAVGMKISILQNSTSGTVVYTETQTPTTNANGLASVQIGAGTVVSGNFSVIDWSTGTYFIKTETDPAGGTNYTITATSQFLSVPYALHSKTTKSVRGAIDFIPFFDTAGSVGTSNIYKDPNTGQIGLNTNSPQATFHIRDNYPSLLLSNYGTNKLGAGFDLAGNANLGTGSASKLRLITSDIPRLEIAANGEVDVKTNLLIGNHGRRLGGMEFQTVSIGTSASNTKVTNITFYNGAMPNTSYVVMINQVNSNDPDTFHFIVRNKTVNGFDLFIIRTDANAGWGQNLQIDYAVIDGAY